MNNIYVVDHVRRYYRDPKNPSKKYLEIKGIGNFFSLAHAKKIVDKLKKLKGFKDYPNGFRITKYTIDSVYNSFINQILQDEFKSKKQKKPYKLFSLYYVLENEDGDEEIALLGLFSTKQKAVVARRQILNNTRLKKLASCLQIFEEFTNRANWEEGFITWKEALEDIPKNE